MRKSLFAFALSLALLLVSVGVKAQTTTLLNESFESTTSGVPSGWDNSDYSCSSSCVWQSTSGCSSYSSQTVQGYNGSIGLWFNVWSASSSTYSAVMTPVLNMNGGEYILRFKYRNFNAGTLDVRITTNGGTTYTTLLAGLTTSTSTEWGESEISLVPYKDSTNVRIIFYSVSNYGSYNQFLDDVSVTSAPTCQSPDGLYINSLSQSGATLNWGLNTSYGQAPDRFRVTLRDANGNVVAYNGAVAGTNTSYTFTGLSGNTTYTAYVRSDCDYQSYAGFSDSLSIQFTTMAAAQNPPYYQDFNSLTSFAEGGIYSSNATLNTTASYSYGNTGKSAQLTTTAATGAYIIFPLLNIAANNMEVDFYVRRQTSGTTNITYQAGYLTDPSDIEGTFVPVLVDSLPKDAAWHNKRFNTGSVTDTQSPVMLCIYIGSGYATSAYIDNVDIHVIPTCTRPENLTITNYGASDVTLDWSMANANNVRVYAMDPTDSTILATALATAHPYQMTGLTPQTDYLFAVRGICSATDSSEISTGVTVHTRCATASTPLFFEGAETTTGSALPDCWETGHIHKATTVTTDPFYTVNTTKHTGTRGFALRDMTSGNIAYLCSQQIDFGQTPGTYSFRYWYYRPSGTSSVGEGLKIFVTPTVGDTTNAVQVISFVNRCGGNSPTTGTAGWNEYEGIINYTGLGYIMVVGYSKYGNTSFFDDMEVFTTPTCPKPSGLAAGNATQSTAELSWTAGNTETQWLVSYTINQGSTNVFTVTDSLVSGQPLVTLTGLSTATTYTVANMSVRAYCGVGDTSEVVTLSNVNFTTQCGALTAFPYTMGFESNEIYAAYSTYYHPLCWTHYNDYATTTSSYHYYPYAGTSYPHTGSRALYYYAGKSSTYYADTALFALPAIDTTIQAVNGLRMKFWARNSSSSYSMPVYVGVMTNPNDPSTFVKVDSVTISGSTYFESTVSFANYTGTGEYIALLWVKAAMTSSYSYIYLDDVTLEPIPSCIDLAGGLSVTAVSDSTATLTMTDQTATNWQYAYGLTGTAVTQMTPVNATGSTLTLTGLTEATTYDIYVRRDCGNSDYSPWAQVTTFSTTAVPAQMPYVCGFEDVQENARWQYADGSGVNVFTIGDATSAVYEGTKAMYVTSDRTAASPAHTYNTGSSTLTYAYRTMHFDAKGYQVNLKFKSTGGESGYDFGRIILCSTTVSLTGGSGTALSSFTAPTSVAEFDDEYRTSSTAKVQLNTATKTLGTVDANGWHTISYFLDMTNRPGDYNLVLIWNDDASAGSSTYPLTVDDINIYELTCIPPSAILTDSISSTGFKLNLQHQTETQFEVVVDDESFTTESVPDSAIYRQIVNNPYAWITGLTANTQYFYTVRTICGANDTSDWSDVTSVNTFCATVNLPVQEGFESVTSTNCWQNIATTGSITRNTSYKHSGSASMKIYEANAVSPELNVTTLAPDMLNGWCYSTADSATFAVGVMTDPNDASTFEPLTTVVIPARNTWTEFTSYFTLLTDPDYSDFYNARYIVISVPAGSTIYFDDFIIDNTPTCPKPTEVSITNIGAHQFDISFTNNAPGCTQFVVTTNGTPHIINTNPATITGLNAASSYSVQIAAICSATDTSYYTTVGNIKTTCDVVIAPYTENFENQTTNSIPDCWDNSASTTSTATSTPYYVWGVYNYNNNNMLRMYNYLVQVGHTEILTPQIGLPAGNGYEFKYDISPRANSGDTYVYVQVFGGTAGFVCVDTIPQSGSTNQTDPGTFSTRSIDLSAYAGDTITIKFENQANYGSGSIFLDNLSVKALLNCSDPNTPTVSNVTAASATVQFTDTCSAHNDWQYVYGLTGFDPSTATPQSLDSMSFTLTGLTSDADYTVYVRANCGAVDGYSNWISASFHTLCTPFHVTSTNSFSEDFSNFSYGAYINTEGVCYDILGEYQSSNSYWAKVYPTTDPSTSTSIYKYCYGHSADNADKCLYWYMYRTYAPNGGSILRQFHLDADSVYELSAWGRPYQSTSYTTKFSVLMGTSTTALDTLTSKTITGASVSAQYDGTNYWYYYNTLYQQIKTVVSVDSTGDYYIGFNMMNPNTSSYYCYAYLDDWTMRAFSGCAPKVATVSAITDSSAHVTMSASAYQFEYVLNDTTQTATIVDSVEFDLTGLNSASAYTLYVRTYCDATNHSEWMSVQFTTACGVIRNFPYSQDFEGYIAGVVPTCWDNSASTATSYSGAVWGVYSYSSNKMLHMWNYNTQSGNAVIETPAFALPAQPVELAFDYTNNVEANDFLVKISTNGGASYNTIGTYPTSDDGSSYEYGDDPGTFTHVIIDLTNYVGQNVKFQLYNQATYGYGAVFFDNMTISYIPACREPQTAPTVTGTTMTTLSAQASMATKDTIEFGIAPYSASVTSASITDTVLSTDGNCTFTGLSATTTYAVWYRYHCDSNEVSDWSKAYGRGTTMSTDCFDPQNLHTIGIVNDHHAEITWGAAPNALNYVYELYQGTSAAGTLVDSAVTTQKPDTIVYDSLSGNTAYFFRVRGFCSGDTTAWVGISIQTTYPTMTMPFVCNFENATINNAWQFNNIGSSTNELIIGTGVSNGGTQALYVSDDASTHYYTNTSTSNADAEVLLEMPAGNYLVQYDWEGYGESCCDYGRVFLVPSSTTISTISTSVPSGGIALDNGNKLNVQSSWTSVSKIVSVPTDGVYKLVVGWHNDGSVGTQPPFAIDNISIDQIQCMPLVSVNNVSLTSRSAKYEATRYTAGLDIQYGYSTYDSQDSITWQTIQGTGLVDTIVLGGLTANTQYYLFVRELCDSTHISAATRVAFQTPASAQTIPFVCGFETSETTTNAWTLVGANNEFVIGTGASSQGSRALYISDDGSTWNYTTTTLANSYAYVPIEFSPGTFDIEYDWNGYGESSYDYGRVYLAPSSFIPTAGTMASGIGLTSTPTGWTAIDGGSKLNLASSWQSYATELTFSDTTVMNLLVFWHDDSSAGTQPPFAIDNINITKQLCTSLSFDSISIDTAGYDMITVRYYNPTPTASTKWVVYSDDQYSLAVDSGVAQPSARTFTATGLASGTVYYISLRSVCGVDTLSKALKFSVRTSCQSISQFPYNEGFEDWTPVNVYYTSSGNHFTQACWTAPQFSQTNSMYACPSNSTTAVHSGNQGMYVYNGYSSTNQMTFGLPEMDSLNGKKVSFWYKAGGTYSYYCTLKFGYINASNAFVQLNEFSNSTAWQEHTWTIANLPVGVKRLAFQFNGSYNYYLDDIHINNVVQGQTYSDTICNGAAYSGHGFSFAAGQLQAGDTTFTSTIQATTLGAADSITTVNIHVRPAIANNLYDTVCAGQPYNRGMWQIANPTTRTYFRTFTSVVTGCDSTVNLNLYVYPTTQTITDTICQGQSYLFGDTTLTTTGTYYRNISVPGLGCTITTTLNLLVESTADTTNATICNGESYQFCGQTYTQSGTYHATTTTSHGCTVNRTLNLTVIKSDSTFTVSLCAGGQGQIVVDTVIKTAGYYNIRRFHATDPADPTVGCYITYHVTATVNPIIEGNVSDYACQDNPYYGNGVNGVIITQDTTIDVTTKNAQMCDSVTHVHLTFTATTYSVEDTTIAAGETYTWHYQSLNTTGVYVDTISSYLGCDSVCTLNLTVGSGPDPSGVDNVSDVNINIVPNPVNAGATAFVYGNFGEVRTVEILNNFGQVIDQFEPKSYPIEVSGIAASGLYYVRVTTVDGQVHLQKLVVK